MRYRVYLGVAFTVILVVCIAFAQEVGESPAPAAAAQAVPTELTAEKILDALKAPVRESFTAVLSEVTAGDLVSVKRNGTPVQVRVYGADCPEPGQDFAEESRKQVLTSVLDSSVSVHVLAIDSQKVPVALLFDGTGKSLGHWLVREGLAWWDDRNASKDSLLRKLNAEAVVAQRGIFSDSAPLAPWDYRRSNELPDFIYALEEVKPKPAVAAAPKPEKPRTLSAKGTMTEDRPRPATAPAASSPSDAAPLSIPGIPADLTKDINVGDLLMRHQPRIAFDPSGRPMGLTANNIGSIPQATQYGFKEGDIVSKVNGIAIESEAQIMGLVPQFMNVKNFQVEVLRNGQTVTIPINIK